LRASDHVVRVACCRIGDLQNQGWGKGGGRIGGPFGGAVGISPSPCPSPCSFTIGVWLPPDDMKTLLNVLDVDRSGEIDQGELEIFWNNAPPLRYLDESQKQYWLKRNVKLDVYSKSMPFHDIRVLYERAVIDLYDMKNPMYTHTFESIGKNVKMDKSFNDRRRSSKMRLETLTSAQMRRSSARFMLEDDIADALMDDYIQESMQGGGGADADEILHRKALFRSLGVRSDLAVE